ncbi:MAG: RNA-binding protein [Bacteroidales bacterium]|nr:RNA-binding protein [Bacteroidales bacterium]
MKLTLDNVHFACTEQDILDLFTPFGEVERVFLTMGKAIVLMPERNSALMAFVELDGRDVKGRPIQIRVSEKEIGEEDTAPLYQTQLQTDYNQQEPQPQGDESSSYKLEEENEDLRFELAEAKEMIVELRRQLSGGSADEDEGIIEINGEIFYSVEILPLDAKMQKFCADALITHVSEEGVLSYTTMEDFKNLGKAKMTAFQQAIDEINAE